ncbi:hypothetical protein [Alcanivorax sp.]|uniref:PKD domain-containing protein n=1 Tax=Alcanivorax sp. TaxID=1872427 RepID=UPI0032D95B9B
MGEILIMWRIFFLSIVATLLVACGGGGSGSNSAPTPNSPQNQAPTGSLTGGNTLTSGSSIILQLQASDEDGEVIDITWSVEGPLTIDASTDAFIQVRADTVSANTSATVIALLRDDDDDTTSLRHTLTVTPISTDAPTVNAGTDQQVEETATFTLQGTATATGGNTIRRLQWTQLEGPAATVDGASDQNLLTATAPQVDSDTDLVFELEAEDSAGNLGRDPVTVTVTNTVNNPLPLVDAGADQTATSGDEVMLSGSASDDGAIASVLWEVTSGPAVTFQPESDLDTRFTAPQVSEETSLVLTLTATDDLGAQASDTVTITLLPLPDNSAPTVDGAYADPGVATSGESIQLIGEASDLEGDALMYVWTQLDNGAPTLAIANAGEATASVTLPELNMSTTFAFRFTASDGARDAHRDISLQGTPTTQPSPSVLECLFRPLQSGCPLAILGNLLNPDSLSACFSNPDSPSCPFSGLASLDEDLAHCFKNPADDGCTSLLGKITDPLYVLETLPPQAPANTCTPAFDERTFEQYIGVLHAHTGYSDGALNSRPADVFARVKAQGLDFTGITDHSDNVRLPLTVTGDCFSKDFFQCLIADDDVPFDSFRKWDATAEQADAASDESYTAFRGFEWTSDRFGHINLFFGDNVINAKTGPGYAVSMGLFWQWFSYPAQFGGGDDALLVFNHPGREDAIEGIVEPLGGDPAYTFNDFRYVAAADRRVVGLEVFGKGSEYDSGGPGGSWLSYALDKGWHVGAAGSEDHHDTEWGDPDLPKTVLVARSRSRDDLREAMQARRFYAVAQFYNGLRMTFTVDDSPMGSRLRRPAGSQLPLSASLTRDGGDFIGVVEVVTRNNTVVATLTGSHVETLVPVTDEESYYFLRVRDPQTGRPVAFSSPVWVMPGANALPICESIL